MSANDGGFTFKGNLLQFYLEQRAKESPVTLRINVEAKFHLNIEMTKGQYEALVAAIHDFDDEVAHLCNKPPYVSQVFGDQVSYSPMRNEDEDIPF